MAVVPIIVKTTRRERFMGPSPAWRVKQCSIETLSPEARKPKAMLSQDCAGQIQPPPEKCDVNACANDPKPPRVTLPELELDGDELGADLFAVESPLVRP
jgi:hypothetical protein